MQSETISTVISFMNHVLVIIINAALLKAFYCGRRSLTTDFHKITIAMVAIMISGGIVHITVEILLFSYGTTVAESWRICTLSGISNTLFGGMLLGCFLLLSLDRWSKIVRFKPLHPRISLAINLFVILAPLVTVALVFMMGDHSFEPL